jgi:hypothetical protein
MSSLSPDLPPAGAALVPDVDSPHGRIKQTAQRAEKSKELPFRTRLLGGIAQGLMSAAAAIIAYLPTKPIVAAAGQQRLPTPGKYYLVEIVISIN